MVGKVRLFDGLIQRLEDSSRCLPDGVHDYPTVKGKRRFEVLITFNYFIFVYVLLHKLIVPAVVLFLGTDVAGNGLGFGLWYLYHGKLILLFHEPFRNRASFFGVVAVSWFGLGYLPLALGYEVWAMIQGGVSWVIISNVLSYGSSLLWTAMLIYRLRMPTTAFLYKLEGRLIPRLEMALPFWILGFITSLTWLVLIEM